MIFCLSIVSLLIISLSMWRWLDPWKMPANSYNVAIADFKIDNDKGKLATSKWSQKINVIINDLLEKGRKSLDNMSEESSWAANYWNISRPDKYHIPADSLKKLEENVKSFAKEINADLIIYGYLDKSDKLDDKLLQLNFYISPDSKEESKTTHSGLIDAFDLKGKYPIGEPRKVHLDEQSIDLDKALSPRIKPLYLLIAGLSSINNKESPTQAIEIFTRAEAILKKGEWKGKEVFYFCMGQVALFSANKDTDLDVAKQYVDLAEGAFNKALDNSNNKYLRPLIGLGSVHLTRAEWEYNKLDKLDKLPKGGDPKIRDRLQRKRATELDAAIVEYQKAFNLLPQSQPDLWSEYAAPLGLGTAWLLQGNIDFDLNQDPKAEESRQKAAALIQGILKDLARHQEYRLLAQAHSNLGQVYWLGKDLRLRQGDRKLSLEMQQKASESFLLCQSQGEKTPNDLILNQQIVKSCSDYNKKLLEQK
jgi:tetratricopeptide (TPR) repeat protein